MNKLIVELSFGVTAREVGTGSGGQESERGAAERKQIQGCSVISYLLLFFSFFQILMEYYVMTRSSSHKHDIHHKLMPQIVINTLLLFHLLS